MIVKCHQSRSLTRNRMIARQTLERNLDFLYNGKESSIGLEIAEKRKRKSDRLRKRKAKEEATKVSENNFNKTDQ
ncbi:hypothetical protein QZH41_008248 [Actinostola sp. cb2023]|nr:hypothetical protein QZH41_008248 [Actinostola sp. cb2023]